MHDPDLVVADDPTSQLDPVTAERVVAMLRERAVAGAVVVLATTDPELVDVGELSRDRGGGAEPAEHGRHEAD